MINALITGGAGFVGSNLAAYLLRRKDQVTVFDSLARDGASDNLSWLRSLGVPGAKLTFVHGDVRNAFDVAKAIRALKPDVVFHLAGQVAMTTSMADPRADFEVNVLGTINVLEALRCESPESAVIYASSNKVYGDLEALNLVETATRYKPRDETTAGIDERTPKDFRTPYGCSKGAADQYMLDYARCFDLRTVVFRHSTIYGGRQFSTYDQGWVGWFVRQALILKASPDRSPFSISGDGKQVRDLLHVSDAVSCYVNAFEHISKTKGEAYNIGGGPSNAMSLLELFAFLNSELGIELAFERLPWRAHDQRYFVADNSKISSVTGWSPQKAKETGIRETIVWECEIAARRAADVDL